MDSTSSRELLKELREANTSRWGTLKELHQQLNQAAADDAQDDDSHPADDVAHDNDCLQVELDIINDNDSEENEVYQSPPDYAQEVVETYDELRQTSAVLEQRLRRERLHLERVQVLLAHQNEIQLGLQALQSSQDTSTPPTARASSPTLVATSEISSAQESGIDSDENAWIRSELRYVAQQIQKRKQQQALFGMTDTVVTNSETIMTKKRPRSDSADSSETPPWKLDLIVLELLKVYQSSPIDPYVCVDVLPIDPSDVRFLAQCGVIKMHPNNPSLICLSDYSS